jgi:hypothetical protein
MERIPDVVVVPYLVYVAVPHVACAGFFTAGAIGIDVGGLLGG